MALEDNDVLQGLRSFQQSVQSLAQTRAINQARETVDQIHNSELDEEQKLTAFRQLGRQFAFQAAASGMPFEQAKGLAEAIAPKPQFYQTADQAALNAPEGSSTAKRAVALIDAKEQADYRTANMKEQHADYRARLGAESRGDAFDIKRRDNQRKALDGQLGDFMRAPDVKPLVEARQDLSNIRNIDENKLSDTAVGFNLMKKGLARLAEGGGKITDRDYEIIQGDPDLVSKTERYLSTIARGKPIKADVQTVRAAADVLAKAAERQLYDAAENYAASKQGIFDTIPQGELRDRLHKRLGFQVTAPTPGPGAFQQQGNGAPAAPQGLRRYLVR